VRAILRGDKGPRRDIVLLNGAFALVAAGMADSIGKGLCMAAAAIDEGRAMEKLNALIRMTQT
jgi:anthranilate phosphoribosyltransferase